MTKIISAAYQIARKALVACYDKKGIVAGRGHFDDYWARDAFWASLGALASGDVAVVKKCLKLFLSRQSKSGQIPLKIARFHQLWSLAGIRKELSKEESIFRLVEQAAHPLDPTALFIIIAGEYSKKSKDKRFLQKNWPALERAAQWLKKQDRDHDDLLESGWLADWMDSVSKRGKVFYLNVCYWKAIGALEELTRVFDQKKAERYAAWAKLVELKIKDVFWNGEFFWDWVRSGEHGNFSTDGNLLACLWGLASSDESGRILAYMERNKIARGVVVRTNFPGYRFGQITWLHRVFGMKNYHNKFIWPWLGIVYALVKARREGKAVGQKILSELGEWFIRHNRVAEIYDSSGNPIHKLFYRSEAPFAWHASMYIYAVLTLRLGSAKSRQVRFA